MDNGWKLSFQEYSFGWQWGDENRHDLRKICHSPVDFATKFGLELVPRDYDMDSPFPFKKIQISISMSTGASVFVTTNMWPSHPNTASTYINVAMEERSWEMSMLQLKVSSMRALKLQPKGFFGDDHIQHDNFLNNTRVKLHPELSAGMLLPGLSTLESRLWSSKEAAHAEMKARRSSKEASSSKGKRPKPSRTGEQLQEEYQKDELFISNSSSLPKSKSAFHYSLLVQRTPSNPKSAPASPALNDHVASSVQLLNSVQCPRQLGKLFSYKEVALAPPGTIVKAVAEQNSSLTDTAQAALSKISEGEQAKTLVEEKQIEPDEHTNQTVNEVQHCKQGEISDGLKNASSEKKKVEEISSSSQSTEGNSERSDSGSQNDGSSNNSKASPKNEVLEKQVDKCLVTSSDHYVAENTTSPQEKNNLILNEQTPEKEDASQKDDNGDVSSLPMEGDKQGDSSHNTSPQESEKQGDAESLVRGASKKIFLQLAPPFQSHPHYPVFGSIPVPSFKRRLWGEYSDPPPALKQLCAPLCLESQYTNRPFVDWCPSHQSRQQQEFHMSSGTLVSGY
nr:protein TSS isoform X2 [Ipomoea batatas]